MALLHLRVSPVRTAVCTSASWVVHAVMHHCFSASCQNLFLQTSNLCLHCQLSPAFSRFFKYIYFLSLTFSEMGACFLWSSSHLRSPALTLKKQCSLHFNEGWPFPLDLEYVWLWSFGLLCCRERSDNEPATLAVVSNLSKLKKKKPVTLHSDFLKVQHVFEQTRAAFTLPLKHSRCIQRAFFPLEVLFSTNRWLICKHRVLPFFWRKEGKTGLSETWPNMERWNYLVREVMQDMNWRWSTCTIYNFTITFLHNSRKI